MAEYTAFPLLQRLETTLTMSPPYCSGILEVPHEAFKLYYGEKEARFIDLLEASTSNDHTEVEALANACEGAKCGRGEGTVLDETYRKAGTMNSDNFMTGLDLEATGLREAVRLGLLSAKDEARVMRAELDKLNVYGEGAFFKPHKLKDTPHSQTMFGSLVVIFPTPHEGGALILRHEDEELTFDPSALLSGHSSSIAYIAFFNDVEYEVARIVSGHHVTLTYNLHYEERLGRSVIPACPSNLEVLQPLHANVVVVKAALAALLDDPTFMPQGGTLGFGLRHGYPLPKVWTCGMESPLDGLMKWLKGGDAALWAACTELGVKPLLRLVYKGIELKNEIALDHMEELGDGLECAEGALLGRGGVRVRSHTFTGNVGEPWSGMVCECSGEDGPDEPEEGARLVIHWLTEARAEDGPRSAYATYGDEASLYWLYTRVCILVDIGPYVYRSGERETRKGIRKTTSLGMAASETPGMPSA